MELTVGMSVLAADETEMVHSGGVVTFDSSGIAPHTGHGNS